MFRARILLAMFLAGSLGVGALYPCARVAAQPRAAHARDELIVKYRSHAMAADRASARGRVQGRALRAFDFIRAEHVRIEGVSVADAIERLRAHPMVEYAEPNWELNALTAPNDPQFPQMYALRNTGQTGGTPGADIRATQAWDLWTGDANLKIGVIDTGVDYTHPDLAANIWTNPGEIAGNGIDDDSNGYVDDVHGYDFVNNDPDPFDDHLHGTHVSGTIAAVGNNGVGVVGVNWRAKIVGIKFLNAGGSGSTAGAIASVQYAIAAGVRLTSNSWGGGEFSQALLDAINAAGAAGQLFVAAAGNAATNIDVSPMYPAAYSSPYILAVAATDHNDALASFSNWGPTRVHLAAPGVSILSTLPGAGYGLLSGTSMATPHVAGAVGFVLGRFPGITALQAKNLILTGTDPVPSLTGIVATGGRLNLFTPVMEPDSIPPSPITDLVATGPSSNALRLTWTATGDDSGTGRAVRYDIRYSTTPITEAGFPSATPAAAPDPQPAGAAESVEVGGLAFNTTYYLAVRAFDEFNNGSPISNVATGTTLGIPDVSAAPTSFSQELLTGATATETLTLRNDGEGTLDWTVPAPDLLFAQPVHEYLQLEKGAQDPRAGAPVTQGSGGPDGFGYRWTDSDQAGGPTFQWVDIVGVGTQVPISGDDITSAPIPMGMSFPFYGTTFTSVRVSSNGFLSFTDPSAVFTNQPLPNLGAPANLIAPMWDDLYLDGPGHALTHFDGSRFIVSWVAVDHYGGGGPYTFQVILHPSGEIRFQYLSVAPPTADATVGIQNAGRDIGLTTAFNTPYLHANLAVRYSRMPGWLAVEPRSGRILAGQSAALQLRFDAAEMVGGDYAAQLDVRSNDPDEGSVAIPVALRVIGAPDLLLEGALRQVQSELTYGGDGARTEHILAVTEIPPAGGTFELLADGDFGQPEETASLTAEGRSLGQTGGAGADCAPVSGSFAVDAPTLAALVADGEVHATVQNSAAVNFFCLVNRHTVRLRYRMDADSIRFGEVYAGVCRTESLTVRNRGTDSLRVTAVEVAGAAFAATPSSFVLGVGASQVVVVSFCPPDVGARSGSVTLHSNDPDAATLVVGLSGAGVAPPDVAVSPSALAEDLLSGGSVTRLVRVENTGGSDLRFEVGLETATPAAAVAGPRPAGWVSVAGDDPPSNQPPPGYAVVGPEPTAVPGATALLVMDSAPWGTAANQQVLTANGILFDLIPSAALAATDLDRYRVVIVASDQPQWTYVTLAAQAGQLQTYVAGGGVLEFHAAGWGWAGGDPSMVVLPGGARINFYVTGVNDVLLPGHPLMAGVPDPFSGTSASHAFLSALPAGAELVVADDQGRPTLAEYRHGLGAVLAACQPLEFGFAGGQATGTILRNLIPYAHAFAPRWLTVEPERGTVPAGAGLDLTVRIDAAALVGGNYRGELRVSSNDPDEPVVAVPVDLHVTGVPDIAVSDSALAFGTLFIGVSRSDTVRVSNPGTDSLRVSGVTVDDADYTVSGAGFVLAPGAGRDVAVTFLPSRSGAIEATLRIASNDPDQSVVDVALHGAGLEPPVIAVAPDSLSADLLSGQTATRTLTVTNSGGSPLDVVLTTLGRVVQHAGIREEGVAGAHASDLRDAPAASASGPTLNVTAPSSGPVVTAGDYVGTHLHFGITDRGEIMPFQYPNGNEHLALGSPLSGYTVAYRYGGTDYVVYAGYGALFGIGPVSYREITNTPALLVAEAVARTEDARLLITRTFTFPKHDKGVRVQTALQDLTGAGLSDVVFKEWADWDMDGGFDNLWDYDRDRNMAYAKGIRYAAIAGQEPPTGMDIDGWNDYYVRATTLDVPNGPVTMDGLEILHYALGDLGASQTRQIVSAFAVGDDLAELRAVVDRTAVGGEWLTLDPAALVVPPGSSRDVTVTFDPGTLLGGDYDAFVRLESNDPFRSILQVPAHLHVTGVPDIAVEGQLFELESTQTYAIDGARTDHTLTVGVPPVAGGSFELFAEGDYGDATEQATLTVEGRLLGQVGGVGTDCAPGLREFTVDATTLAALVADGVVHAQVQNTPGVNPICAVNRHTVRLRYRQGADSLRFGTLFLGQTRELGLRVLNAGTDDLILGSATVAGTGFTLVGPSFPRTLQPGQNVTVLVRFAPGAACPECAGTLTLSSNDPDEASIVVALAGAAVPPPEIGVSPSSLVSTLVIPASETQTLTIGNTGGSDLIFTLTPTAPVAQGAAAPRPPGWTMVAGDDPASDRAPAGYAAPAVAPSSVPGATALLVQDAAPWGTVVNQSLLAANGIVYDLVPSSALAAIDLSRYRLVIVASDQPSGTYFTLAGRAAQMESYVLGGGVLEFHGAGWGWSGGDASVVPLPGGTRINQHGAGLNDVLLRDHPLVAGVPDPFTGSWASHAYLTGLPAAALRVVADDQGRPTLAEYRHGQGVVLVSCQTLEYGAAAGRGVGADALGRPPRAESRPGRGVVVVSCQPVEYGAAAGQAAGRILANMIPYAHGQARQWLAASPASGTVPAGGALDIAVEFRSEGLVAGVYRDLVRIVSNDPGDSLVSVPATLNASVLPDIDPVPASLDFSTLFVGQSRTLNLLVRNAGMAELAISSASVEGPAFGLVGATFPIVIAPAGSRSIPVRFAPAEPCASCAGTLAFVSNDPDESPLIVPLSGVALLPPDIELSPASVRDTTVIPGVGARTFTVHNTGFSPLTFSISAVAAAESLEAVPPWLAVTPGTGTVAAGESLQVQLSFTTAGLIGGTYVASLRLATNDPDEGTVTVPVTLVAIGVPDIAASPVVVLFGDVFTGYSRDLPLELSNPGTDTLRVTAGVAGDPGFTLVGATIPFDIAPLATRSLTVRFAPSAPCEPCSTGLVLRSNDPDEDPFAVPLLGTGLIPPDAAHQPALVRAAAATTLGPDPMVRTKTLRIENSGGSTLEFSTIAVSTADSVTVYEPLERTKPEDGPPVEEEPDPRPGILGNGGPDRFGYRWRDSDSPGGPRFQWVDITGVGTRLPLTRDDNLQTNIDIGFLFRFYGFQFRRVNVCTNGFLSFTSASVRPFNDPLPNSLAPNNLLAAFWDDLDFGFFTERAWVHNDGSRFIVTWDGVPHRGAGGPYTFQIILYPTGRIVYQYLRMGLPTNSATVGIQNNLRNDGLTVAFNTPYVHDSLAVEIYSLPRWLSASPASGSVPPGGSADLEVRFDADQLPDGDYSGAVAIQTNDPDEPALNVPCDLHVGVVSASLDLDPNVLNRTANGNWVSCDIELPPGLDPQAIVLHSVRVQRGLPVAEGAPSTLHDSDEDGLFELRCKFDRVSLDDLIPDGPSVPVEAVGEVGDLTWFQALDVVRMMRPGVQDSPNADRIYLAGSEVLLEWSAPPDSAEVRYDLWYSDNGGESWSVSASGITGQSCTWTVPALPTESGRLELVALDGQGVRGSWLSGNVRVLGSLTGVRQGLPVQLGFRRLSENPSQGAVRLELALPERTAVDLRVFDVHGAAVRRLAASTIEPGWHTVEWDGHDDAGRRAGAGIYFVRMTAGGRAFTLRLALVR